MKILSLMLLLIGIALGDSASAKVFFEPKLIAEYSNREQNVSGSALDGTIAGQSYRYGAGFTLYFTFGKIFTGFGYSYLQSIARYQNSDTFEHDDSWGEESDGVVQDAQFDIGYKMKGGSIFVGYTPLSKINYSSYFIEGIEEAEFTGSCFRGGLGFQKGKKGSLVLYIASCTYSKGEFDGVQVQFPGSFENVEYESLKSTNIGVSFGLVF